MSDHDRMSAEAALREMDRAQDAVRQSSKWGARFYVGMWLGVTVFWLITFLGTDTARNYAMLGLLALSVAGMVYISRQRAYNRLQFRLSSPIAATFVGATVLGALYNGLLRPQQPGPLWLVADVLVALAASAPLLYGALRIHRAAGDR
ncbi:hypothetical protein AB0I81_29185 [Nonomuraea sp. NPDC050404]|uniref:hypothetical protein n=1 Tax=Nonomuraea sp. NPDC050404 TaxID=3155783 RepID=UPI0033C752EB